MKSTFTTLSKRLLIISGIVTLTACQTMNKNGGLTLQHNGKPSQISKSWFGNNNWQTFTNLGAQKNFTDNEIEVDEVYDGSLRILIPAKNIFYRNSLKLNKKAFAPLKSINEQLLENTNLRMKVVGHTDSSGNDINNQLLSINRATQVARFFIKNGLHSVRIEIEGRSSLDPIVNNTNYENRLINRRVELYLYPTQ